MASLLLLGTPEVITDGRLAVTGKRRQSVLALLAARRNTDIAVEELLDQVWSHAPGPSGLQSLRSEVHRLRHVLRGCAEIESGRGTYRLHLGGGVLDIERFETLVSAPQPSDEAATLARLDDALALWRGRPFGEVVDCPAIDAERHRLEMLREIGIERRIGCQLVVGADPSMLAFDVEALVERWPLRERLWAYLMRAYWDAGRQADALAVYRRARRALIEGLGVEPGAELRALEQQVLAQQVEPLKQSDNVAILRQASGPPPIVRMPALRTSFVGRVVELAALREALVRDRLITLVGPGGIGKTRLALQATADGRLSGRSWFVDLAALTAGSAVADAVAAALGVHGSQSAPTREAVVQALRQQRAILVIDNCEHVREAVADLVTTLLDGAPLVTVLATSREPLAVVGEQVWPIPPLDPTTEAASLFIDRASAADHFFDPTHFERTMITSLCANLDGLPLAIELAAAHIRSIGVVDLCDRLEQGLGLPRRYVALGTDPRHATVDAVIEWSYNLLEPNEAKVFDRLSVFAGSFDLGAATAVCTSSDIGDADIANLCASLVNRSMVQPERSDGRVCMRMLETLRQYGADRLALRGEQSQRRVRHLTHYAALARWSRDCYEASDSLAGRRAFEHTWDNLRAALDTAEQTSDATTADQLVRDTFWFAYWTARDEHAAWTDRRVQAGTHAAEVLAAAGLWAATHGAFKRADGLAVAAIAAAAEAENSDTTLAWFTRAFTAWYTGRRDDALVFDRITKRVALSSTDVMTSTLATVWSHPLCASNSRNAIKQVSVARAMVKDRGNITLDALVGWHAGAAQFAVGDVGAARREWEATAELAAAAGNRNEEGFTTLTLALRATELAAGDAARLYHDAIRRLHELRIWAYLTLALTGYAAWCAENQRLDDAALLLGYLDRHEPVSNPLVHAERLRASCAVDRVAQAAQWRTLGFSLTLDELVERILSGAAHRATLLSPPPA